MGDDEQALPALGDLIRLARESTTTANGKHWTQDELASRVFTSKQWISRVESGRVLPSFELLVKLHGAMTGANAGATTSPLAVWLLKWLEAQVPAAGPLGDRTRQEIQTAIDEATGALGYPFCRTQPKQIRTLSDFPRAFEPLTIICGDRREDPPRTRGDVFAYSVSIVDLTYLLELGMRGGSTVIKSDKLFAWMDDERLEREFGNSNLLVIGSPSVNLAARRINALSVFQFAFDAEIKEWERQLRNTKDLNDRQYLRRFWQIARNSDSARDPEAIGLESLLADDEDDSLASRERAKKIAKVAKELLKGNKASYWMNRFRKPGFLDPVDGVVHGLYTREDNDFGLISLARNPFAKNKDYVCIFVAGIHGPGTAHALRLLGGQEHFEHHPFGGIIEVELDLFNKDISNRFENVHWEWQTGRYTPASLLESVQHALRQAPLHQDNLFSSWCDEERNNYARFVRDIADAAPST